MTGFSPLELGLKLGQADEAIRQVVRDKILNGLTADRIPGFRQEFEKAVEDIPNLTIVDKASLLRVFDVALRDEISQIPSIDAKKHLLPKSP